MEKTKLNNRIAWVDIAKFICIMCVMCSHLESNKELLSKIYQPFFLTAFFFLSGYTYKQPQSFKVHFIKKIKGLFIPWFIFSNFNIFLSAIITLKGERNIASELFWNLLQIRGERDGVWFVAALFVVFIPFYFFIKWNKPFLTIIVSWVLSFCSILYSDFMNPLLFPWNSAALPWHIEYIFQAMFWMVLGYYFRSIWENLFDKYNNKITCILIWIIYFVLLQFDWQQPIISILWSYIISAIGISAITSLTKIMKTNRYFSFVGSNTLIYFALHGKIYAVIEKILWILAGEFYSIVLSNIYYSSFMAVIITFILSVVLIIPAIIINRWFPWVIGRGRIQDTYTR